MKNDNTDPPSIETETNATDVAPEVTLPVLAKPVVVDGWQMFPLEHDNFETLVKDTVLAEHLGYGRVRDVRKLVKKLIDSREIPNVLVRATVARTRNRYGESNSGRVVDEYWLTEEEALTVCAASDAPRAKVVRRELIRVYVAYRRGLLVPANDTVLAMHNQRVAFLESAVEELKAAHAEESARQQSQLETLARLLENGSDGPIGKVVATEHIRQPLHQLASLLYRLQTEPRRKTLKSIKTRLANQARAHVDFPSTTLGNDWSRLPKRQLLNVENWIFGEMRRAEREAFDLAKQAKALSKAARQMSMGFCFKKAG